jgi:hypothetical protein
MKLQKFKKSYSCNIKFTASPKSAVCLIFEKLIVCRSAYLLSGLIYGTGFAGTGFLEKVTDGD